MNIFIETMGCPKNLSDSEMLSGLLIKEGHMLVDNEFEADAIIINTCGFINDAKIESIDKIFEMEKLGKKLIVTGCLTQRYGDDIYNEIPEINIIAGVNNYKELVKIISEEESERAKLIGEYQETEDLYENGSKNWEERISKEQPWSSTIKISEGCDNNCAYCVIPSIRGHYRSRLPEDILAEARFMAGKGVKELILIGQDTTNYGSDFKDNAINSLAKLVRQLCKIEGIKWIRLMYCYEDKITDELINTIKEEEKVCNYLDIPLQHGADSVLKGMRRKSTSTSIRNTISKLRREVEDIHIRTTFIVGFPGETEEDYDVLYEFAMKEKFERLGVFSYSMEEGTPAAEMPRQVDEEIKEVRKNSIMNLQIENSRERNEKKIGQVLEVLIEEEDEEELTYIGRTRFDAPEIDNGVIIKSKRKLSLGEFVEIKVEDAFDYDIVGIVI